MSRHFKEHIRGYLKDKTKDFLVYILLTPWTGILLQKITVTVLLKKFSEFTGN